MHPIMGYWCRQMLFSVFFCFEKEYKKKRLFKLLSCCSRCFLSPGGKITSPEKLTFKEDKPVLLKWPHVKGHVSFRGCMFTKMPAFSCVFFFRKKHFSKSKEESAALVQFYEISYHKLIPSGRGK